MRHSPDQVPGPFIRKVIKTVEKRRFPGVLTSSGVQHIPAEGKTVFVANHRNDKYDARALGIEIPRGFYIPAKDELRNKGRLEAWAMQQCGALYFDREDDADRRRVAHEMEYHLAHGAMIGIFSEGGSKIRGPRLGPLENGAGALAAKHGALVVPVGIGGTELEPGEKPEHTHVAVGEGFYIELPENMKMWPTVAREVTARLQQEVQEMFDFAREQAEI